MTKVSLSSVAPEGKQQHKHANNCPLSPWPQQYGWLKVVGTVANGKLVALSTKVSYHKLHHTISS